MANSAGRLEGLAGFEQLDIGELYYIGNRRFVERGLLYFRQFAVESLEWDEASKLMTAAVSGRRSEPYQVCLWVRGGQLGHECDCPAWDTYGGCKHAIAAAAAMFLAVQGKGVGGFQMPVDYAQALREQLGYTDVGTRPTGPAEVEKPATELQVLELYSYGGIRFRINGPVPQAFLRSVGVVLPGNAYGFSVQREFFLGDVVRALPKFLRKAKQAGIAVTLRESGGKLNLRMATRACSVCRSIDLRGREVVESLRFATAKGVPIEVLHLLADELVLAEDGTFHKVSGGSLIDRDSLARRLPLDAYNRSASLPVWRLQDIDEELALQIEGAAVPVQPVEDTALGLILDCSLWENAAAEPERLDFELLLSVDGVQVDQSIFRDLILSAVLDAYSGTLLSAKRRVSPLLDLIRRVLADAEEGDAVALERYVADYPELFSNEFRVLVIEILNRVLKLPEIMTGECHSLAADGTQQRWLAYQLDVWKVMMLLFSMTEPTSRRALNDLRDGSIPIKRGASGMDEVRRLVQVAGRLGVQVRFNELPVRTAPLSISVDTKTRGSDIDWFALHPTIRCAERTITADEWIRLIQGQLLLKGSDGALIVPEIDEGSAGGLKALAELLRSKRGTARPDFGEDAGVVASRLEMLDWIALRRLGIRMHLPPEAEVLFRGLTEFEGLGDFSVPACIRADLRPYQLEGCAWVDFLYRHRFGACLADDMGLGKTLQAIGFIAKCLDAHEAGARGAVLVVLPPSLVFNWSDEFARFAPEIKVRECLAKADWADALTDGQVVLTTYDRVRLDQRELSRHVFDVVVFDEAHNLKNVAAARTKAAMKLQRRFTLCLTGTPVENHASEYYSVMSLAVPGLFGSLKAFKESFRTSPERILGRAKPFILRRRKQAILKELPRKEEHELLLEMSTLQKEIYTRTVAEVREEIAKAYNERPEQQAGIAALAAILRLRQVCVSPELMGKQLPEPAPKFAYMADKLEELQAEGHAALIFSQFIGGLDQMERVAKERGIDLLRMDGSTPVVQRREIVESFQSGRGPAFFLISLKTGGVGLNLTRANYVFHLDPWWNPAVENQASDRAHRIGQTRSVFIQRLIMQHSIEARMVELKARKADLFRQLVDEPGVRNAKAGLQREDFEYLLYND
ncbi:DEAD/DEAH box helicase [Coraliomargarita parva]|uniref:DEAD/DEAH box helicase n=1 Tax=Coraliomargarita parva TaxID=3014050 RepID=UPI0022B35C62|nr:DEAD/DEAH box helicase [Coraliomargarita parva]